MRSVCISLIFFVLFNPNFSANKVLPESDDEYRSPPHKKVDVKTTPQNICIFPKPKCRPERSRRDLSGYFHDATTIENVRSKELTETVKVLNVPSNCSEVSAVKISVCLSSPECMSLICF